MSIELLMESGKVREAWELISRCCQQVRILQTPPSTEALDQVSTDRADLYRCRTPEGLRVPLLVCQSDIKDGLTTEAEVSVPVRVLEGSIAGGPPGMRTEDLKGWIMEATCKKEPVRRWGELVVRLVQRNCADGTPLEELEWTIMVLIPKGKGGYRGIGIVEVAWYVCAAVVNYQLKSVVVLHDALRKYREG